MENSNLKKTMIESLRRIKLLKTILREVKGFAEAQVMVRRVGEAFSFMDYNVRAASIIVHQFVSNHHNVHTN